MAWGSQVSYMDDLGEWLREVQEKEARDQADLYDLLVRVSEYLDNRSDTVDGEDGEPMPNDAMSLGREVDAALEKLRPVSK